VLVAIADLRCSARSAWTSAVSSRVLRRPGSDRRKPAGQRCLGAGFRQTMAGPGRRSDPRGSESRVRPVKEGGGRVRPPGSIPLSGRAEPRKNAVGCCQGGELAPRAGRLHRLVATPRSRGGPSRHAPGAARRRQRRRQPLSIGAGRRLGPGQPLSLPNGVSATGRQARWQAAGELPTSDNDSAALVSSVGPRASELGGLSLAELRGVSELCAVSANPTVRRPGCRWSAGPYPERELVPYYLDPPPSRSRSRTPSPRRIPRQRW
jgi:hypothetical protein